MSVYDITTHGARSEAAIALYTKSTDAYEAFVLQAESQLLLSGTSFSGDDAKLAKLASVLQVNYLLATDSDFQTLSSETRGPRSVDYKNDVSASIDQRAQAIMAGLGITLTASDPASFETIRRLR